MMSLYQQAHSAIRSLIFTKRINCMMRLNEFLSEWEHLGKIDTVTADKLYRHFKHFRKKYGITERQQ